MTESVQGASGRASQKASDPPDSLLRQVAFGGGCLFALVGLAIGAASIYGAFFPGGSGEWEGAAQLAALMLQVPAGIAVLGLAFAQSRGRRRSLLLRAAALIILVLPLVTQGVRHAREAWYLHQLEQSTHFR